MGILRRASTSTKRIDLGDDDYIEVKVDLAQGDFERLAQEFPSNGTEDTLTPAQTIEAAHLFFEMFVTGWSLKDERNRAVRPSVKEFQSLVPEAASAIGNALVEHFNSLSVNQDDSKTPTP